jgi:hypothetical protein
VDGKSTAHLPTAQTTTTTTPKRDISTLVIRGHFFFGLTGILRGNPLPGAKRWAGNYSLVTEEYNPKVIQFFQASLK